MIQHVKHSDTASMADIQVKLPSHLVSDEVRRRVEAHKVYRTEVGAALNTALEVATALMDAEDFDAESLKEMDSIASEWHDMDQQLTDQSAALNKLATELAPKSESEIGAMSLPSHMHGIIHTLVTAASRGANAAKVQQSWMDRVHEESSRGSQRYPGGWKIGGAAGAHNAGDDDVQVVAGSGLQLTCPITQKTLVQPVRNLACKHCYEQAAITEALERHAKSAKRNADMKCPVAGCSEKVSKRSIQRSQSKEAEVKRALKRQAAQSSSSQETAGEDDGLDLT